MGVYLEIHKKKCFQNSSKFYYLCFPFDFKLQSKNKKKFLLLLLEL